MNMIIVLSIMLAATFLMSVFNWYEEGYMQGFLFSSIGSIFGGSIATLVLAYVARRSVLSTTPFKLAASLSVGLSLVAYTFYAFNGKAENSSESAAHMHVVLFPILHATSTAIFLVLACIVALLYKGIKKNNA